MTAFSPCRTASLDHRSDMSALFDKPIQLALKQKVVSGIYWRFGERLGSQITMFFIGIALARLLGPAPFGTIALLAIFMNLAGILVDCGFGKALVQKETLTETDCSTAFATNVAFGLVSYVVLWIAAPWIAVFYNRPDLSSILRLVALGLFVSALDCVPQSLIVRRMDFRLSFRIELVQNIVYGITSIALALSGAGLWTLVFAPLAGRLSGTAVRWATCGWWPARSFSKRAFHRLFSYGWKLSCASAVGAVSNDLAGVLIGRFYTPVQLAFYGKGNSFPNGVATAINATVSSVSFSALSKLQNDQDRIRKAARELLRVLSFLLLPCMGLLAGTAPSLTHCLLGPQWKPIVPFVQLGCFAVSFSPFSIVNIQTLAAIGRSDLTLKLEIAKKGFSILVMLLTLPHGVMAFAIAAAFLSTPVSALVNIIPNRKVIRYGIRSQLRDAAPAILVALLVFSATSAVGQIAGVLSFPVLLLQSSCGVAAFFLFAATVKPTGWKTTIELFRYRFLKQKGKNGFETA